MRNGRTFPYRPRRVDTSGDGEGQASGVLDAPVKAGRPRASEARPALRPRSETKPPGRSRRSHAPQKNRAGSAAGARTKTDTGGRVEHTEAIGGTAVKELGTMAPQLREKGCRLAWTDWLRERRAAAANRPKRLFTKNTGLCQAARRSIGSDACPVPEGYAEVSAKAKHRSQAPVNGGRNYNGPKVAKFLVG